MGSIGETLRSAREAKGINLQQAEEDTKIRKKYLQALEEEDYERLPGRVYAKGFLRNYAKYLGLNQEEILMEFKLLSIPAKENYQEGNLEAVFSKKRSNLRSDKKAYMITVIVAVFAIVTLVVFNSLYKNAQNPALNTANPPVVDQSDEIKQENEPQNNQNQNTETAEQDSTGNAAGEQQSGSNSSGVNVTLNCKSQDCWAKVTVDDAVMFTGTIHPGDSKTFSGVNKIVITLGNAGSVEVIENGRNLGTLGPFGKIIKNKEFTGNASSDSATEPGGTGGTGGTGNSGTDQTGETSETDRTGESSETDRTGENSGANGTGGAGGIAGVNG